MKSANILLDDQWNAKVSDIGLSTLCPANGLQSTVIPLAAGTVGYCDPQYAMTNTLTKESDVCYFGVVLVEVLWGTLCYTYTNSSVEYNLVPTWIKSYEEKKLINDIIFKHPAIQPLHESALETFSHIAYQCLKESLKDRPKMADVVTELETALANHVLGERKPLFDYEEMTKPPLNYRSKVELWKLLCKGVLLNRGKTWLSSNTKGEHCETISFSECLDSAPSEFQSSIWSADYYSR
ncbi:putative serine/threonine-protein kinase PBL28 [Bidens hawaiensis]|uniref:putative serine/threonine-protein kinase PBL28 n=1 Tax=Bidens hawaiensis TaxID=980011 RepID=UPI00404B824B